MTVPFFFLLIGFALILYGLIDDIIVVRKEEDDE